VKGGLPEIQEIREAAQYLKGKVNRTELHHSTTFSQIVGGDIYFKMENHQKTGSFKARGALNRVSRLTPEEKSHGIITASSGNHAQGVAYAAMVNGINAKIVMPEHTVPAKINAVQGYGADVVLRGRDYSEARDAAETIRKSEGRVFIEAFNDPYIIAGQGNHRPGNTGGSTRRVHHCCSNRWRRTPIRHFNSSKIHQPFHKDRGSGKRTL
jgi:L-threonine ammonia-lyase (EC 4.3.1.19)